MKYSSTAIAASRQSGDCVIVGIYNRKQLNTAAQDIDDSSKSYLTKLAKSGDLPSTLGKTTLLRGVPGIRAKRLLVVGLGNKSEFCVEQLDKAVDGACRAVSNTGSKSVVFNLASNQERFPEAERVVRCTVAVIHRVLYRFDQLKTKKSPAASKLQSIGFGFDSRKTSNRAKKEFAVADAIATGVSLTKDLGNYPANVCTPDYLAKTARDICKSKNMTVQVMGIKEIKKFGMGAFASVTAGATRPPRLIVMRYRGAPAKEAPTALVGKGITFDTGGISLKPPAGMDEMKYDMCGAGSVLGVFKAVAKLQPKINLIGIVAACENMPNGNATRPGDIVKTMSGKTVEILNTDAEGRLILCDALTYAKKFKPKTIIDIATLTGACVIALGEQFSGLMSPHDELAQDLLDAGTIAGDGAWRMPVTSGYVPRLSSNFADFANVGGRPAGAVTAACFLWQFMKDQNWAHLDIAGSAWRSGPQKGATGRPVGLLVHYLLNHA